MNFVFHVAVQHDMLGIVKGGSSMFDNPVDELISELDRILPPVVARTKVSGYLGGMLQTSYLATLDSDGKGPEGAIPRLAQKTHEWS